MVVAASAAALAGSAGVVAGAAPERVAPDGRSHANRPSMQPGDGSGQVVAASADVPAGVMRPFDGSVVGFVRRVNGQPEAISGVRTHQGCRLWFDRPLDQLHCPCHPTSFSPTGQVLGHLPRIAQTRNRGWTFASWMDPSTCSCRRSRPTSRPEV